ncbi:hypothetical protein NBRC116583_38380 [Arenicella sp. 4NH20-0111]
MGGVNWATCYLLAWDIGKYTDNKDNENQTPKAVISDNNTIVGLWLPAISDDLTKPTFTIAGITRVKAQNLYVLIHNIASAGSAIPI